MFRFKKSKKYCEIIFVLHIFILWIIRIIKIEDKKVKRHNIKKKENNNIEKKY